MSRQLPQDKQALKHEQIAAGLEPEVYSIEAARAALTQDDILQIVISDSFCMVLLKAFDSAARDKVAAYQDSSWLEKCGYRFTGTVHGWINPREDLGDAFSEELREEDLEYGVRKLVRGGLVEADSGAPLERVRITQIGQRILAAQKRGGSLVFPVVGGGHNWSE